VAPARPFAYVGLHGVKSLRELATDAERGVRSEIVGEPRERPSNGRHQIGVVSQV
jgi:hypothetical protein